MKKLQTTIAALAMITLTAGCSSVGNTNIDTDGNGDGGAAGGDTTAITVGVIPTADSVPAYLAKEDGIFEKHGLDVTLETAGGGAAITSSVLSGSYDLGLSNVVSADIARDKNFPVTIVAPAAASTGEDGDGKDFGALLASPKATDITSIEDVQGKTVAINALNNANDVLVREAIDRAGGDPSDVNFVEIPFQDLPGALANGRVDAAVVPEPFRTMAMDSDAKWVYAIFADVVTDYPASIYLTTDEYASGNAEVIENFRTALAEAAEIANDDSERAKEVLNSYTEMSPDLLERIVLPKWPTELNKDGVDELFDLTAKFGIIQENDENKKALVTVP